MAARAALHSFIVRNIKDNIISTRRYLIIKKTLFSFKKKFMTTISKKRH